MDLDAYVDVVPWLLFVVVDRRSGLGLAWAAASAMGCGAALGAWARWRGRRTPVGWVAMGVFGSLVVVAVLVARPHEWFEPTLRAIAVASLGLAALASLRRRPLSEAYTAERVPMHRRSEPAFLRVNRRITASWGVAAFLIAASFATVGAMPSAVALTLFDWVVPIVVLGAALRWVAAEWSVYQVSAEGTQPASLSDTSLGFADGVSHHEDPPGTPERRITYLPGVQPGS